MRPAPPPPGPPAAPTPPRARAGGGAPPTTRRLQPSRDWARYSGRSTELWDAAVVTARSPSRSSPKTAVLSASVAFEQKHTRRGSSAPNSRATARRAPRTASDAVVAAACAALPGPPKLPIAFATASATCGGLIIVVAALSK